MKYVTLPSQERVPAFGLGTWRMGDDPGKRLEELATVRLAVERGVGLIDTAEMYGDGRAERLVGEAIGSQRDGAFLVSKVLPGNATRRGTIEACHRSLRRLGTDRLDLYLLHWRGEVPLAETLEAFAELVEAGKIRYYGVSNLDKADMEELWSLAGGRGVASNQLFYNLAHRGIECDLLPWLRQRGVPVMAYSPLDQGKLAGHRELADFALRHGLTPAQAALAWLLAQEDVIAIPKCGSPGRLKEDLGALEHRLSQAELDELDGLFPKPRSAQPLEMV